MARPDVSFLAALRLLIHLCDPVRAKEADESQCEQAAAAALSASLLSPLASVALTADNTALVKLGVVALHQLTLQLHRPQVRRLKHRGLSPVFIALRRTSQLLGGHASCIDPDASGAVKAAVPGGCL